MNRQKIDVYVCLKDGAYLYDAGIVSQNIYLFASGCGLATVCRGTMDRDALVKGLKLTDKHFLYLNHPVGYPK